MENTDKIIKSCCVTDCTNIQKEFRKKFLQTAES